MYHGIDPRHRLKEWRQHRGITKAELSRASGVSEATISRLERMPYRRPHLQSAQRITAALGIGLLDLWNLPHHSGSRRHVQPETPVFQTITSARSGGKSCPPNE